METIVPCFDMYLNRVVKHVYSDIRQSKLNPKVYYMTEFVRLSPLGEESAVDKEFKIGQSADGYHGYYRAYIFIPSYWKFSSYSAKDMAKIVEFYGNKVIYKRIEGPEGTMIDKHNCIGWAYDYGLEDESLIGKEMVSRDIAHVIKEIVDWEWDNDSEVMTRSAINEVYEAMSQLTVGLYKGLTEDEKYLVDNMYADVKAIMRRNENASKIQG